MAKPKVRLGSVSTARWRQAIPKHLADPLRRALDASEAGDMGTALQWFGVCADKCDGPTDPNMKPVLYFGGQAASAAYFTARGKSNVSRATLDGWRQCAETLVKAAWEVDPADPVAAHNVGRFLHDCDEFETAISFYKLALQGKPHQVESWGNLGTAYANLGDRASAAKYWDRCVAFEPENPSGALAQAYVYLRKGDYLNGWRSLEWRWQDAEFIRQYGRKDLGTPRWRGDALGPKDRLYVHGEQGLGDHVQFARYVTVLVEQGVPVVAFETRPTLKRWMTDALSACPQVAVLARDVDPVPKHTHHVSSMSLPALLGTTVETIPEPVAPFRVAPVRLAKDRKRVAIAWCGAAGNPADNVRSIPAHELAGLAGLPVDWVSVQFTEHAGMIARSWLGDGTVDASETCRDVLDTASVLATCDLVVTVDTLTAHLAGSLGVPTIVLHRFDREWRWLEDREDSPWYPGSRHWTQERPTDWAGLVARVRADLGG